MDQISQQDFAAIVVAAGRSTRFGSAQPKQFLDLAGRLVVERSIDAIVVNPAIRDVIVVLAPTEVTSALGKRISAHPAVTRVVAGGETRADSVALGLAAVSADQKYVLVHDAARPLVSEALVARVVDATRDHGAAVPVLAVPDTVKRVRANGQVEATLDRSVLRLAQTPQGASREALSAALAAPGRSDRTDEAAALEAAGHAVMTVEGDPENGKITTAEDLARARRMLEGGGMDLRVGTGFDVHRVDAARPLILAGVLFEGEPGLEGHSDADIVFHAVIDAVLGATGQGDIGQHFPPTDATWKGADSAELARTVTGLVRDAGFRILNIDLTVLAERPKIGPRADEMRARLAECFGLDVSRVGLKATTLERMGALGRHEGMGCQAVALVVRDVT